MQSGSASAVVVVMLGACATSPPPLPPPRQFAPQPPVAPLAPPSAPQPYRAPDLAVPAEPPVVHERYLAWTLAADAVSLIPLTYWLRDTSDVHYALPSLLLPPIIHGLHGETTSTAASLAMRIAMLGALYLGRQTIESECEAQNELICVPIGSIMLMSAALTVVITVDSIFLARRTRPAEGWFGLPVKPAVGMGADGRKWLSLGGSF